MLTNFWFSLLFMALPVHTETTLIWDYVQVGLGAQNYPDQPTKQLLEILENSFHDVLSVAILHDGSPMALNFLQRMTDSATMWSYQMILMTYFSQSEYPMDFSHQIRNLNLFVVVFEDINVPEDFLLNRGSAWIRGSLIFINLSVGRHARSLLTMASNTEKVSLLEVSLDKEGRFQCSFTSYFPFGQVKFSKKVVDTGQVPSREMIFQERFPDFGGRKLYLASWMDDFPILFYAHWDNATALGLSINLLEEIKAKLNFSYSVQDLPPDGMWGDLINGSWVGMAGQLVRKEKDIIANSFAVLHDRHLAMDFTVPIFYDSYSAVLKLPPPPPRYLGVIYPFTNWVWLAVILSLLFITIFLSFQMTLFDKRDQRQRDVVWVFLWLGRGLLRQPVPGEAKTSVLRITLCFWWMCALVLSSSYFGNLIAYITIPDEPQKIRTLEELANSHHKLYMLDYGAPLPNYLATSVDPVLSILGQKLILLPSYEEIEEEVLERDGVIIEGTNYMAYEIAGWREGSLYYVGEALYPSFYAWAFQKSVPWIHRFDRYLVMMIEAGLVSKWRKDIVAEFRRSRGLPSGGAIVSQGSTKRRPLSLTDLQAAFIVLGIGCTLSTFVFLLQMIPV